MKKLYILVRCRKCKHDLFDVYKDHVSCVNCGKLYIKPKTEWTFNVSYDTMRTKEEKESDKPIE